MDKEIRILSRVMPDCEHCKYNQKATLREIKDIYKDDSLMNSEVIKRIIEKVNLDLEG